MISSRLYGALCDAVVSSEGVSVTLNLQICVSCLCSNLTDCDKGEELTVGN